MPDVYTVAKRSMPEALRQRGQDYARPWMLLKNDLPLGYYKTQHEAQWMMEGVAEVAAKASPTIEELMEDVS